MINAERRRSMAERRPSTLNRSSFSAERKSSIAVVPHLAGIEDPLPETTPDTVDVVLVGTGLVESILAAALSWQGSSVLQIDSNSYYGDTSATLTIDQLKQWVQDVNKSNLKCYENAKLHISSNIGRGLYKSREFGIDLSPKILFAKSDLLSILLKSRVHQYLEFQSLSNFHTYENDSFERLTNTKQEIFTNPSLPLMTKRNLMKFIKFVLNWETQAEVWEMYRDKPVAAFLVDKFKLEKAQVYELIFSIGLCYNIDVKTPEALQRIRRYLTSFDVYGPFPVLYSKYGGPGELSQGFCRSAAVAGATYKLNESLVSYDPDTKIAIFGDGSKVGVTEKVVIAPTQCPENSRNVPKQKYEVQRLTCVVDKPCSEWFGEGEYSSVVVFPPNSLKSGNRQAVQALIMGAGSDVCPTGTSVWYLTSTESGPRGEMDLDAALGALEESIMRESSADIENDEGIMEVDNSGHMTLNSVKLGQSFKEYIPREKLQILVKLYFKQLTSTPPFEVVDSSIFDINEPVGSELKKLIPGASDNGVLYTPLPSAEISYDEAITAARMLFQKIVGSDDDFFDLDFDDEDEQIDESAVVDDDEDDKMNMTLDVEMSVEPVDFAGEMEI
ncbi:LANO_0C00694g1_1 [Lachancea nothofagi CBS 11611]|uniref:Rab proteins geranylgeranyltransferase component A n=1 Tax=Lachancea nothofagi CBS 11611 TaxID=1266666 RepID=A0A1G4J3T5_9SACH|nr:LANO_0C00694g1_1 [Lachancea nothofagi CBS 11611]